MKRLLTALAITGLALPAYAAMLDFTKVDTDQNGAVSWEEVQAASPDISEDRFKAADADSSGDLSAEELQALMG